MNKILVVSTSCKPGGGPQGYTFNLKKGVESLGYSSSFSFWSMFNHETRTNSINISKEKILLIVPSRLKQILILLTILITFLRFRLNRELIRKIKNSDTIIINDQNFFLFINFIIKRKKKLIYMQHTPTSTREEVIASSNLKYYKLLSYFLGKVERKFFIDSHNIIIPSRNSINSYDLFGIITKSEVIKKLIIIPSGVPKLNVIEHYKFNLKQDKISIGYIGRYHDHKGFDVFINLFKDFKNDPRFHFYSAGSGNIMPPESINYTNIGWTKNVAELISQMDLIICPNKFTYFDLLPLEVMSIGTPLLLSPIGGNIDLSKYSEGIYLSKSNDISDYRFLIESIFDSSYKLNFDFLKEKNRLVFQENFTQESMAKKYIGEFVEN